MAERLKDDDSRALDEARRRSAEAKAAIAAAKRQKEKAEAEARVRAKAQGNNTPAPAPVQGPRPKPQVPQSFETLRKWKKAETPEEKAKSWADKPRPLTREDAEAKTDSAFTQWVQFKRNEPREKEPKPVTPPAQTVQPFQLTRPTINTSAPPISASGTVGAQTQPVRRQTAPNALPDVLRGQYQEPERKSFDVPERPATMGVPTRPLTNIFDYSWATPLLGTPETQTNWSDVGQWLVDHAAPSPNRRPVEDKPLIQTLVPNASPFQSSVTEDVDAYVKWYQSSGAEAFRQSKSDRRWGLANATIEEKQARADEIAANAQQIVAQNPAQALLGGQPGNTTKEGWQQLRARPAFDWFGNVLAGGGSVAMDILDAPQAQTSAFITEPSGAQDSMSPGMVIGALADQTREQLHVDDEDPNNQMPMWANAIAAPMLYLGNAFYAATGIQNPTNTESIAQRVQDGVEVVNRVRTLPEAQRKEAVAAIPNMISGVTNATQTADFILTRKAEAAKLRQQAQAISAEAYNPAWSPEQRQQAALQAAQLGAQANSLDNLYIADIVEMNQDPIMEFIVGAVLDPTNLLDMPLGMIGDLIRSGRLAKRLGTGFGDAVSNVDAIKYIDNAVAQADELMTKINTGAAVDIRTLKGRPAAEKSSKGLFSIFGKSRETLVQARTEQVFNVLSGLIPPNITTSDAKIILTALIDNPRSLVDGLPAEMFTSPVLTETFNVNGLVKYGNSLVAPKFLNEYYPILKAARDDLLGMVPLQTAGNLNPAQFIAAVDDIVMDTSRRLMGMSKLPSDVPLGTSKIEVRRAPAPPRRRNQPPPPPSTDGFLIYKDSHGNVVGQSDAMPMPQAVQLRKSIEQQALASGTTGAVKTAAVVGNFATLRPFLTDMYLGLRPANWVKNAASAYAVMFADNVGSFRPLTEIESYMTAKMGDLMGNQRVAQGIAGTGPLSTQFGVVDRAHWLEKVWKNNPYSKVMKKALDIPYGNTGIKLGGIELPVGEQNFYARIFQSAFERTFNPAIEKVTNQLIAPLLQQGLDPAVAQHAVDYLNYVGRTSSKADYVAAAKSLFGNASTGGVPPTAAFGGVPPRPAPGTIPRSPAAFGVPKGVLSPQTEKTVMEAIASGDMQALDAAMAAELKQQIDVLKQAPPQAGVAVSTDTAIINEAEDIEDMARMAGADGGELVSRFVQQRQAAYAPLLNDLATSASTVEAADVITAFMGVTRRLQEQFGQRIDGINGLAVEATQNALGSTSGIHAQRWQEIEAAVDSYLQDYQSVVNGFRSRLAAGNIDYELTIGRNVFDKLVGTPDVARPVVVGALEYGTPQYKAVIAANTAARDKAYLGMWDAARRNPSMLALDTMLAADDRVGDIYRALAADVEDYKKWLRSLGPGDHTEEWAKFYSERDLAYAEYHNVATAVYDSARAGIVAQSVAETTYKAGGATYKIVSRTEDGWRVQKLSRDGVPSESTLLITVTDRVAPPPAVARKWQEAQAELTAPPVKPSTVGDDRLMPDATETPVAPVLQPSASTTAPVSPTVAETPLVAPVSQTAPIAQGGNSIPNEFPPPAARPTTDLFTAASQAGIATTTKTGAPFDKHLLNSINKHADEIGLDRKILSIKDMTDDELRKATAYYNGRPSVAKKAGKVAEPVAPAVPAVRQLPTDLSELTESSAVKWLISKAKKETLEDGTVTYHFEGTLPSGMRSNLSSVLRRLEDKGLVTHTDSGAATIFNWELGDQGYTFRKGAYNSTQNNVRFTLNDYTVPAGAARVETPVVAKKAVSQSLPTPPVTKSSGVVGNKTQAWTDPNNPVNMQYEVVEYSDLIASNTPDGRVNPAYPAELQPRDRTQAASRLQVDNISQNLNPKELLADTNAIDRGSPIINGQNAVESGNGRMMALGISPKYDNYKTYLIENASQYGIDPAAIQGMNRPVLVRRRLDGGTSVDFARQANARTTLSMNAIETGRMLANQLTSADLMLLRESGGLNKAASRDFVNRVMNLLPANERAAYIAPDGTFTTQGKELLRSTLFSAVFKDDAILRNYVLAPDPVLRNTGLGIEQAIADLAVLEKLNPELAIGDELARAANTLIDLREQRISVQEFAAQTSMFDQRSPEFMAILQFLDDNMRSGKNVKVMLRDYANRALAFDPNQTAMFAEAVDASKLELLQTAMKGEQESFFGGFGFVPPDDWFTGWNQLTQRGRNNMGQTAPQMGAAASHMARQITDAWQAFRRGVAEMPSLNLNPAQQMAALDSVNDVTKMWDDAIVWSQQTANRAADYAMLNFNDKRNFDTILSMVMPYHYFWSRSMLNWTKRLARKPSLLNFYFEVERDRARSDRMNDIENGGLPARVDGRFPALGDWFMGNPLNLFMPVNSYMANEFVDPSLANNRWEKWYMQGKQWTPLGGIAIDMGMAQLFDTLYPRGEGAQLRTAEFGFGDYMPLVRQATSAYQGVTGEIVPAWVSGDPYAYGTSGRAAATNLDVDPSLRKWALDVGTQILKGLPPLPEQPAEAKAIWTAAVKEAGWTDWQAKAMAFVLGLPFAKVTQDERTMRQDKSTRGTLGYNGGENATGSKMAVDLWDEQTGDASTLLAQYPELYPSNTASNPDEIDFGRPGLSAARDDMKVETSALDKQREAEINAYIQQHWGEDTSAIYDGVNAIIAKYKAQEAAIKAQYPSVDSGGFNPTAAYYRNHSPQEVQAAAEAAAKRQAQTQVGSKPAAPGEGASNAEWTAYRQQQAAYDQAYQNALAAILADPSKLSGGVAGMPTTAATDPQARAAAIIADRSYQPEQQQRLGARSKQEAATREAKRQEGKSTSSKGLKGSATNEEYQAKRAVAEGMFGAEIWDVVDGYDKDWTQDEKKAYFQEHPELLAFWDFWYGEKDTSSRSSYSRPPFLRTGFPGVTGSYKPDPRSPLLDSGGGGGGSVGFPNASDMYDPRWAQYEQQARTAQPGNWQPSNRRQRLRDIPLATLRTWA